MCYSAPLTAVVYQIYIEKEMLWIINEILSNTQWDVFTFVTVSSLRDSQGFSSNLPGIMDLN